MLRGKVVEHATHGEGSCFEVGTVKRALDFLDAMQLQSHKKTQHDFFVSGNTAKPTSGASCAWPDGVLCNPPTRTLPSLLIATVGPDAATVEPTSAFHWTPIPVPDEVLLGAQDTARFVDVHTHAAAVLGPPLKAPMDAVCAVSSTARVRSR